MRAILCLALICSLAAGCAPTATSSGGARILADGPVATTDPAAIILTEGDIADRRYEVLSEIAATAQSPTGFSSVEPTQEMVEAELRSRASTLGADAVINVSYGTVDPLSAGGLFLGPLNTAINKPLQGSGTAVRFVE